MTTAVKPLPPHGTPARYRGTRTGSRPPCRCRPCTDAHTRACAARELANLSGRPLRVPAGPVTAHVQFLVGRGMSCTQISIAAGVARATVANAAAGRNLAFNRTIADKIMTVQPRIVRDTDRVPFTGTQRRIQALHVIGHGPLSIATATGLSTYNVRVIAHGGRGAITAATYRAVRAAYRELICTPGPSPRARKKAIRLGWLPPIAWDDIDDPNCKPEGARKTKAKADSRRVVADVSRVAELTAAGRSAQQIADELGCHSRSVVRARRRAEMAVAA